MAKSCGAIFSLLFYFVISSTSEDDTLRTLNSSCFARVGRPVSPVREHSPVRGRGPGSRRHKFKLCIPGQSNHAEFNLIRSSCARSWADEDH